MGGHHKFVASDYDLVQKPANADYYNAVGDSATGTYPTHVHYAQVKTNNGQQSLSNTHTTAETTVHAKPGVIASYSNGYDEGLSGWKTTDTNVASNYAMTHSAGDRYNGGVHVAQGLSNDAYYAKHSKTRFSVNAEGDY